MRVTARPQDVSPVETLTFDFSDVKDDAATLSFSWEKTKVSLAIGVDNAAAIENAVTVKKILKPQTHSNKQPTICCKKEWI